MSDYKKIIVQIIPSLRKGGAERFVVDLSNALAEYDRNEVWLISLFDNSPGDSFVTDVNNKVNYRSFNKGSGFNGNVLIRLQYWLYNKRPHVIHTHINSFEYVFPFRLFFSKRVRFFHTIHSKAEKECPIKFLKIVRGYFYKRGTVPVTISQDGSNTFKSYYGLDNDVLIENGRPLLNPSSDQVNLLQSVKNSDDLIFVHVGRISNVKNQVLLIKSVQLLNQNSSQKVTLLIIGGCRDKALYNELSTLAGSDDRVLFLGEKNNIVDYLSMADAFCLSSTHEGMPISLIEALSVGCIPICTAVGGIPEMIEEGETGFLSADTTVNSYRETISRFLASGEKQKIKENCIELFRTRFDIDICATKHRRLYHTEARRGNL